MTAAEAAENNPQDPPWKGPHTRALAAGEEGYNDPVTGLWVWTEIAHRKRGACCNTGCRHCPWREET
ncbi:MAG: hypothetical protein CBC13_04615 [Planctomycetia bacterium TMED53]|nr:MAG: hypothetical protein CBC13_04615 [Planctomycetia bacterium TMED53]